jgi:glyoxylate utilization-related uncharacterized protein
MMFSSFAIACESNCFIVYYMPIEANFYTPPTRDYIIKHGKKFEIESYKIKKLFDEISKQDGLKPQLEDYQSFRILIIKKDDMKEVFITSDKRILFKDLRYDIDIKVIDDILEEILSFLHNKGDSK